MRNKWIKKIDRYVYSRFSIQVGIVLMMMLWFIVGRKLADNNPFRFVFVILDLLLVSTIIADEVIFQYKYRLELTLRNLMDTEGFLLPKSYSTDRLTLRALEMSDYKLIRKLSKDRTVTEYIKDIDFNQNFKMSRNWVLDHIRIEKRGLRCTRIITLKSTGEAIGAVVFINGHELEYWTLKKFREQGYTFEAIEASINIIEQEDNIVLFSSCSNHNKRSVNMLEKLSFKLDEDTRDSDKLQWVYSK